jgi:hypothetical protein
MRRLDFILTLVTALWLGARVEAQPLPEAATAAQKQAASTAYHEGKTAYESHDFAAALDAFNRSHENVRSPNTELMVARSLRDLGRAEEARAAYQQTIAEAEQAGHDKYGAAAQAAQSEVAALPAPAEEPPGGEPPATGQPAEQTLAAAEQVEDGETDAGASNPLERRANLGLVLGAKIGGGIGSPVSDFGASYALELELGWALPIGGPIGHSLGVFLSAQYTQPGLDGLQTQADPRLPGKGVLHYDLTQQLLGLSAGLVYRIPVGSKLLMPYGGLGARMYLLKTKVKGDVGTAQLGENNETRSEVGLLALGGVELYLGPGALLGELSFSWAKVDAFVLRKTAVGGLGLALGYRIIL